MAFYSAKAVVSINVLDIVPYKQIIKWYKPENTLVGNFDFWDMELAGSYSVNILQLSTLVTENAKAYKYSLVDAI